MSSVICEKIQRNGDCLEMFISSFCDQDLEVVFIMSPFQLMFCLLFVVQGTLAVPEYCVRCEICMLNYRDNLVDYMGLTWSLQVKVNSGRLYYSDRCTLWWYMRELHQPLCLLIISSIKQMSVRGLPCHHRDNSSRHAHELLIDL